MTLTNKIFRDFSIYLKGKCKFISIEDKWNLFNIYISNPFCMWWRARRYFKIPKTSINFFFKKDFSYIPSPYVWEGALGKILDINIGDVGWKDKWNSPRHEWNPGIFICFFRKFGVSIQPHIYRIDEFGEKRNADMEYWEYLLNYVCYNRGLKLKSFWTYESKIAQMKEYGSSEGEVKVKTSKYKLPIFTHLFSLNRRGLKLFKRLYDEGTNSRNYKSSSKE